MHTDTATDHPKQRPLGAALLRAVGIHGPDDFEQLVLEADQGDLWRCTRRDGVAVFWLVDDPRRSCYLTVAGSAVMVNIGRDRHSLFDMAESPFVQWRLRARCVAGEAGAAFVTALSAALHLWD